MDRVEAKTSMWLEDYIQVIAHVVLTNGNICNLNVTMYDMEITVTNSPYQFMYRKEMISKFRNLLRDIFPRKDYDIRYSFSKGICITRKD